MGLLMGWAALSLPASAATSTAMAAPSAAAHETAVSPTDINAATQAELEMVIGIGPDLSGRILESRQQRRFRDWADVMSRLKGIGPARALRLSAEGLRVEGQAYAPGDSRH
jgi:competence protein ComEA